MTNSMEERTKIIVVGASAGGLQAITRLVSVLPENLPAPIFIVMHLAPQSSAEIIRAHLQKHTSYICTVPLIEEPIQTGYIYIAPPDQQMIIKGNVVTSTNGAHENRWRPSIDVLFRSAAAYYNSNVIGIVLTGMLYDGTAGMSAIKRSGGTCIIQEPDEAEFDEMPQSVLKSVDVDYRVPISDMGYILDELFWQQVQTGSAPEDIVLETEITERMSANIAEMEKLGIRSAYSCPDCGGGLWRMQDERIPRYRCHTGHAYLEPVLLQKQGDALKESIWICIRLMEERRSLLLEMAGQQNDQELISEQSNQLSAEVQMLKKLSIDIAAQSRALNTYLTQTG